MMEMLLLFMFMFTPSSSPQRAQRECQCIGIEREKTIQSINIDRPTRSRRF